ncbi:MAG: exosortase system-associated protein, TIGR04073 family [Candidatus Omnitrophica bacterium]|nr:exosortase system-associated protein, TIGR04073 family [Candidatus Omnitrophota bacterium]
MNMFKIGMIFLLVLSIGAVAYADSANVTPDTKGTATQTGSRGAGIKAERGVKNILFGWTEIPKSIIQVSRDTKNPIWGITAGTFKGVGKAFPRTVSGIADVATFPLAAGDYNKPLVKPDELNTQVQ